MAKVVFVYTTSFPEIFASVVLQALIPARHIGAKALYFAEGDDASRFLDTQKPDVLIFTKLLHDHALTLAEAAKARGVKIIGMIADLRLDANDVGRRTRRLSAIADKMLAATEYLRNLMVKGLGRPVDVLEEPIRFPRQEIQFAPGDRLNVLWCGHDNNYDTLKPGIRKLAEYTKRPVSLMITSNRPVNMEALKAAGNGRISIHFALWSPELQYGLLESCDFVFLPSVDTDEKKSKGHDRLVEAINAGRWALAHPLPQYQELGEFCYCGNDYASGIEQAVADPTRVVQKLREGQTYIDSRFGPNVNAAKWEAIIDELVMERQRSA